MYSSLRHCINDLEKTGQLIRITTEIDPNLEAAEIHRRVFDMKGPALLFENIKGSSFQAASNLFGTYERTDFLFRKTLEKVKRVTELKADISNILRHPIRYLGAPFTALSALPRKAMFQKPVLSHQCNISDLPFIKSWSMDGGAFITLPQVCTLPPASQKIMDSNIGMYRIQLNGNDYKLNEEVGLHYQLHRGIGVHHTAYNQSSKAFKASIFVGGPPAHSFAAIMPMPENISELTFAGMLAGRRFRYLFKNGCVISADADFCIVGEILKDQKKPEGPFGDHLGYYSLSHDFPVMKVEAVYHRPNPIWHFTVVGRPPQEDSSFGYLIHKLVEALTPGEFPGLVEINAVDAAGVHPLLLAIGKERYMPFREKKPEEILTIANRILGSGQTSLAKFLFILAKEENETVSTHNIAQFFDYFLRRVDWKRDLHFQTKTTIDTLDYSGSGWNVGSKVVIACCGDPIRKLESNLPTGLTQTNAILGFSMIQDGILAIKSFPFSDYDTAYEEMEGLKQDLSKVNLAAIPLIVICDDYEFISKELNNFLWVTFTRANPSHDLYGFGEFIEHKHWGCKGSLIIDARIKPHHAPPLIPDPIVSKKVDRIFEEDPALRRLLNSNSNQI